MALDKKESKLRRGFRRFFDSAFLLTDEEMADLYKAFMQKSPDAEIFWLAIGKKGRHMYIRTSEEDSKYEDYQWQDMPKAVRQSISRQMNMHYRKPSLPAGSWRQNQDEHMDIDKGDIFQKQPTIEDAIEAGRAKPKEKILPAIGAGIAAVAGRVALGVGARVGAQAVRAGTRVVGDAISGDDEVDDIDKAVENLAFMWNSLPLESMSTMLIQAGQGALQHKVNWTQLPDRIKQKLLQRRKTELSGVRGAYITAEEFSQEADIPLLEARVILEEYVLDGTLVRDLEGYLVKYLTKDDVKKLGPLAALLLGGAIGFGGYIAGKKILSSLMTGGVSPADAFRLVSQMNTKSTIDKKMVFDGNVVSFICLGSKDGSDNMQSNLNLAKDVVGEDISVLEVGEKVKYAGGNGMIVSIFGNYATVLKEGTKETELIHLKGLMRERDIIFTSKYGMSTWDGINALERQLILQKTKMPIIYVNMSWVQMPQNVKDIIQASYGMPVRKEHKEGEGEYSEYDLEGKPQKPKKKMDPKDPKYRTTCTQCGKEFDDAGATKHAKETGHKVFKSYKKKTTVTKPLGKYKDWDECKADGKSDEYCGYLEHHAKQKRENEEEPQRPENINAPTKKQYGMAHDYDEDEKDPKVRTPKPDEPMFGKATYTCPACGKKLGSEREQVDHYYKEHGKGKAGEGDSYVNPTRSSNGSKVRIVEDPSKRFDTIGGGQTQQKQIRSDDKNRRDRMTGDNVHMQKRQHWDDEDKERERVRHGKISNRNYYSQETLNENKVGAGADYSDAGDAGNRDNSHQQGRGEAFDETQQDRKHKEDANMTSNTSGVSNPMNSGYREDKERKKAVGFDCPTCGLNVKTREELIAHDRKEHNKAKYRPQVGVMESIPIPGIKQVYKEEIDTEDVAHDYYADPQADPKEFQQYEKPKKMPQIDKPQRIKHPQIPEAAYTGAI